jgi:TatD DNase family protein
MMRSIIPSLFDSHAHLDRESFGNDLDIIIDRARKAGVIHMIAVGASANIEVFNEAVSLAEKNDDIHAVIGIHPHNAGEANPSVYDEILRRLSHPKISGIGEIGLDFHYNFAPHSVQEHVFRTQLDMAANSKMPVVIHCREAHSPCRAILREYKGHVRGVIHCFSGDLEDARSYIDMEFSISIPGVVTFKNAHKLAEVVRNADIDRILIETDSPYLAPEPLRGKRNEPANVLLVAEKIAEIKGMTVENVASITSQNAFRLFDIR